MNKFNIKKYNKSICFICKRCSYLIPHTNKIGSACSQCGHNLFKVTDRSGTPGFWDRDDFKDPYLRQKQKTIDPGSGRSMKMVNPADEQDGGGLGTRVRGKLFPDDFSIHDAEYDEQRDMDIPGSYDTLLDNPPTIEYLDGKFYDPIDPLSTTQQLNRDIEGLDKLDGGPIDAQLKTKRIRRTINKKKDDIYNIVSKRQKE